MGNKQSKEWKQLDPLKSNIWTGYVHQINNHELIIATRYNTDQTETGIYIHNLSSNHSTKIATYPVQKEDQHKHHIKHCLYNKIQRKLYFYNAESYPSSNAWLESYDIKSNKFHRYESVDFLDSSLKYMINIGNQLHFCKPSADKYNEYEHYIYNMNTQRMEQLNNFVVEKNTSIWFLINIKCVHLSVQNKIIAIFCYCDDGLDFGFDEYSFDIYSFDIINKTWIQVSKDIKTKNGKDPGRVGEALLTADEQFIIITPIREISNDIFYIDVREETFKLRKSNVSAPEVYHMNRNHAGKYWLTPGERDGILVYGFIRVLCNGYGMKMPSKDLMSMMVSYYVGIGEMLHCVVEGKLYMNETEKQINHWCIPVAFVVT